MILISIFDSKSGSFHAPLAYDHISNAVRSYISFARSKPDATQVQFAEDYTLYEVAEFNTMTGVVTPLIPPNLVENMVNIVAEARKAVQNG